MNSDANSGKLTRRDLLTARILKAAPFVVWGVATFPVPIFFTVLYFFASEDAAVYLLTAFATLGVGAIVGILAALMIVLFRRGWERRLRDRLAADGITVEELPFFQAELKSAEKLSLRRIERENAALADAYSETLAARLTATRLLSKAKRELVRTDSRIARAKQLTNVDTKTLESELAADRERLEDFRSRAQQHLSQAEAQLQTIEAASTRSSMWEGTDIALERLGSTHEQPPLALEAARLEMVAREQVQDLIRNSEPVIEHERGAD
jgi:hypothetical protein